MATSADTVYGNSIRYLIYVTLVFLFFIFSLASYSDKGYTLVKYPGVEGSAVVCVEGEVHPTNQSITVINMDEEPTENPIVTVNEVEHVFNRSVSGFGLRKKTNELKLGCNKVSYEAESDTKFKVKISYLSHWRPVVKSLEISNLKAGHTAKYFIVAKTYDKREIVRSRLNITDMTRDVWIAPLFDKQFNGSAMRFKLKDPGHYDVEIQAYDGYVWSDVYETGFTSHVIVTDEKRPASNMVELEDDEVLEHGGFIPTEVNPDDIQAVKVLKRFLNGAYMLVKRTVDLMRAYMNQLMDLIKEHLPI